jgi:hypothetical protein
MHVYIQDKSFLNENVATGLAVHANKLHQDRQCSLHSQRYSKHVCNMPSGNQTWQYRKSNIHRRLPITAGASSEPMARQEEEDAVEPVAGARGMALSAGWESPFLPTKTMERYGKGG